MILTLSNVKVDGQHEARLSVDYVTEIRAAEWMG